MKTAVCWLDMNKEEFISSLWKNGLVHLHCRSCSWLIVQSHDMRLRTSLRVIIIVRLKSILVGISYRFVITGSRAINKNSSPMCYSIFEVCLAVNIDHQWKIKHIIRIIQYIYTVLIWGNLIIMTTTLIFRYNIIYFFLIKIHTCEICLLMYNFFSRLYKNRKWMNLYNNERSCPILPSIFYVGNYTAAVCNKYRRGITITCSYVEHESRFWTEGP